MKKTLIVGLLMASVAFCAPAADLFNAKELSLSLSSTAMIDNGFKADNYSFNLNAGVQYALTKHFFLAGEVPFYRDQGVSVDRVTVGAGYRLPIGFVAPYIVAQSTYRWLDERITPKTTAGVEFRVNSKVGFFIQGSYDFESFKSKDGNTMVSVGIRGILF